MQRGMAMNVLKAMSITIVAASLVVAPVVFMFSPGLGVIALAPAALIGVAWALAGELLAATQEA